MMDVRFQPMKDRVKDPLKRKRYLTSPFKARTGMDELERELGLLLATNIVIESGHDRMQIRNDGWPRGGSSPSHPDIRLFFECKHGSLRYECNAFNSWEANLRAIGLWLQRQRLAIEEWGIGTGGEAYRGFAALPPGASAIAAAEWANKEEAARFLFRVVDAIGTPSPEAVSDAARCGDFLRVWYKNAARKAHPDAGGTADLMSRVNRARDFIEAA